MIPLCILAKFGRYKTEIEGFKVTAKLRDNDTLINDNVSELRSFLRQPIVGFDVKFHHDCKDKVKTAALLILCAGNSCLAIQLHRLTYFPHDLKKFLEDESICFVGTGIQNKITSMKHAYYGYVPASLLRSCVEVGELAAKVLKKPNISGYGLVDLGNEVDMKIGSPDCSKLNLLSVEFSTEQMKDLIHDAYMSYVIGVKLLDMLDA